MEYLGSVDVHVTLSQGQKVATKFYLQDDAALDLIAEHIDLLNDLAEQAWVLDECRIYQSGYADECAWRDSGSE